MMIKRLLLPLVLSTSLLFSQEIPDWAKNRRPENPGKYYFGIGVSSRSEGEADNNARIEFTRNVQTQVETMIDHQISEDKKEINEVYNRQNLVKAELSLKGINVSERYFDSANKTWYSLIQYEKDAYQNLFEEELKREAQRLKAENKALEDKKREEIRHKQEQEKIEAEKKRAELQKQKEAERLKEEKLRRQEDRRSHIQRNYGDFIGMPAFHRLLTMENAEIIGNKFIQDLSLKGSVYPASFLGMKYSIHFKVASATANFSMKSDTLLLQDAIFKLRLLEGKGEIYRSSVAIGAGQYLLSPINLKDLKNSIEGAKTEYTVAAFANVHIPQFHLVNSLQADFRQAKLGAAWYPFFKSMPELALLLELGIVWDEMWRNRHNDLFIAQPGLLFTVIPDRFFARFGYEQNEFATLNLDFQF